MLLEAFVNAKPVIMTDCPGPREIAEDGVDSLLFPIDDASAPRDAHSRADRGPRLSAPIGGSGATEDTRKGHTFSEQGGAQLGGDRLETCGGALGPRRARRDRRPRRRSAEPHGSISLRLISAMTPSTARRWGQEARGLLSIPDSEIDPRVSRWRVDGADHRDPRRMHLPDQIGYVRT